MPLYEYQCENHGVFDEFRAYSEANQPVDCPACGETSYRVMSIPRFKIMDHATRVGMERNEKSRHEPRVHTCHGGCNHGPKPAGQPRQTTELKSYRGSRPWVVEHA